MNTEQSRKIEELYLQMFENMKVYACCNLESEALAEEAVQETFRIACQRPERLCESDNPRGWLVRALKFTISNIKHDRTVTGKLLERYWLSQSGGCPFSEDQLKVGILYEDLADTDEFMLLAEMAIEGRSHLEMAASRGISVNACKKRVQRAKESLRKRIEE
jgi:RNA polymerase sigma-70 factor (ECF subfamily)